MPITTLASVCWRLVDAGGNGYPDDPGPSHHDTAEEATKHGLPEDGLTAAPFDRPCVVVTCDGCGAEPDDDEFSHVHFPSEKDAADILSVYDFASVGTSAWCEDCTHLPHEPIVGPHGGVCDRCGEFDDAHEPVGVAA